MRLFCTFDPPPEGFSQAALTKALLLAEPLILCVRDMSEIAELVPEFESRMRGVIVTIGHPRLLLRLSGLLWHLQLTKEQCSAPGQWDGWLQAIACADASDQVTTATNLKAERIARELEMTRVDYNVLTQKLMKQLRDLETAKKELGALNEGLERRVEARTAELANANGMLNQTLSDLRRTQNDLVRAGRLAALGHLVAGVAHELNTPIGNALMMCTTLTHESSILKDMVRSGIMKRSALEELLTKMIDSAAIMERNLSRAADFVSHFKQLAVDQVSERRREFSLASVIQNATMAMRAQLKKAPVDLIEEVAPEIVMDSYPGAISQILTNLIENALTHAFDANKGRSGGRLSIQASAGNGAVLLSFADDGSGISQEHLEHIFEPFYTTKFGRGGSGLGLYILYSQVHQLLGGTVDCKSTPGRGTRFDLRLPIVAPQHRS